MLGRVMAPTARPDVSRRVLVVGLALVVCASLGWTLPRTIRGEVPARGDSHQFLEIGYYLSQTGRFAMRHRFPSGVLGSPRALLYPNPVPELTAYRPPAFPAFVAAVVALTGEADGVPVDTFTSQPLRGVRTALWLLQLASAALAAWLAWLLSGHRLVTLLTFGLAALDPLMARAGHAAATEPLAAFLLVGLSLALAQVFVPREDDADRPARRVGWIVAAGVAAAVLALTRAAFAWVWLAVLPALVLLARRRRWGWRHTALLAGAFCVVLAAVLVPWVLRNQATFGRAFIAERGGYVVYLRSRFASTLDADQLLAGYGCWSGSPRLRRATETAFGEGICAPYDDRGPEGLYRLSKEETLLLYQEQGHVATDATLMARGLRDLSQHPVEQLWLTPMAAWRTLQVLPFPWGLLLMGSLLGLWVQALRRGTSLVWLGAALPSAYSFVFHAFWTQGLPRFSQPLLPIAWAATAIALVALGTRAGGVMPRRSASTGSRAGS